MSVKGGIGSAILDIHPKSHKSYLSEMESLQIDSLLSFTKSCFDGFTDKRAANLQYKMGDIVQSALALFSLKDSSLLAFNNRFAEREDNLLRIYKITNC
ncbi:MAG: hypothetical protein AAFV25_16595, partial [Bacteroidota bacterium]